VKLFETSDSGVNVVTDEVLEKNITLASGADQEMVKTAAIKRAKDYVRAIGRIMLHSMAHEYFLPAKAMSPFFMTGEKCFYFIIITPLYRTNICPIVWMCYIVVVLFHGYDETYHRDDILRHVGLSITNAMFDIDGNETTRESFFAKTIPEQFIHSRKMLLGSLQDGLTIGGCSDAPSDIAMGCGLARDLFFSVPLEAIQKIHFSKSCISLEDLLKVIAPVYGDKGE
jgi:hypothetical protein